MHTQVQIPFLHFTLFGSFGMHAKDTNFTFGTPHTHIQVHTKDSCTHTDTGTIFTFCTFWLIWLIRQRYLAYHTIAHADTQTCTHIDTHIYRDINTQIQIH